MGFLARTGGVPVVLLILASIASSCARSEPTLGRGVQPALDTRRAQASVESRLDPRLEARLDAYFAFADWGNAVFGKRVPNPPSATRAKPIPARGPFRRVEIASMEAYTFGYARSLRACDTADEPFAPDGSLCLR